MHLRCVLAQCGQRTKNRQYQLDPKLTNLQLTYEFHIMNFRGEQAIDVYAHCLLVSTLKLVANRWEFQVYPGFQNCRPTFTGSNQCQDVAYKMMIKADWVGTASWEVEHMWCLMQDYTESSLPACIHAGMHMHANVVKCSLIRKTYLRAL